MHTCKNQKLMYKLNQQIKLRLENHQEVQRKKKEISKVFNVHSPLEAKAEP